MILIKSFWDLNLSGVIQILVSAITLSIAYGMFQLARRIRSNHAQIEQVKAIKDLVSELNQIRIGITFSPKGAIFGRGHNIAYNIFEIANLMTDSERVQHLKREDFNDQAIIFSHDTNKLWNINHFVDNPFIPSEIANELENFYISGVTALTTSDVNEDDFVIINTGMKDESLSVFGDGKFAFVPDSFAFQTWLHFKQCTFYLENEIKQWFKQQGIDINLRIDYKNKRI